MNEPKGHLWNAVLLTCLGVYQLHQVFQASCYLLQELRVQPCCLQQVSWEGFAAQIPRRSSLRWTTWSPGPALRSPTVIFQMWALSHGAESFTAGYLIPPCSERKGFCVLSPLQKVFQSVWVSYLSPVTLGVSTYFVSPENNLFPLFLLYFCPPLFFVPLEMLLILAWCCHGKEVVFRKVFVRRKGLWLVLFVVDNKESSYTMQGYFPWIVWFSFFFFFFALRQSVHNSAYQKVILHYGCLFHTLKINLVKR